MVFLCLIRSPARDDKPNRDHEPDDGEQNNRSDDLIAGEAHRLSATKRPFAWKRIWSWNRGVLSPRDDPKFNRSHLPVSAVHKRDSSHWDVVSIDESILNLS